MDGILYIYSKKVWKKTEIEHGRVNNMADTQQMHLHKCKTLFSVNDITCLMASFHSHQKIHYIFCFCWLQHIFFCVTEMRQKIAILDFKGSYYFLLLMKCTVTESTCCSHTSDLLRVLTASLLWDKLTICIQTEMCLRHVQESLFQFEISLKSEHFKNWDENQNFPY
jgi:hypothetical protein